MENYVLTFFEHDIKGTRRYQFQARQITPPGGVPRMETTVEIGFRMLDWIDTGSLGRVLRANGIQYMLSARCVSSIVVKITDEDQLSLVRLACPAHTRIRREADLVPPAFNPRDRRNYYRL